ncbi:uncharacterized protein LOC116025866 isoform X2 [Ipomoea triloba]|uniref:uncharacterized protein LOC116025866 isoform X1 n=1 Tax=Ipomoea triloba TaxID=35885 RepID=UPI00125CFE71|nr:uncharacterized protein LOC116025866 isoform X1 [Ipomoea triloba]XP_031123096.1 uncharacterized protein LOC116025866 isoform X2 [Ipomoea triloba]
MLASTALNLGSFAAGAVNNFPAHNSHRLSSPLHGFQSLPLSVPPHAVLKQSSLGWKSRPCVRTAVAAVDSSDPAEKDKQESERKKYYFVVANAKFMLDEEEHFQEQLFERLRLFGERDKEQDFWLVIEPKFLDKFPNITKKLKRPAVALVSTNGPWITFMKLRLDRVLQDCFEADSLEEALASNPAKLEFEKPANWTAPYPKYNFGWWEPFLPPGSQAQKV